MTLKPKNVLGFSSFFFHPNKEQKHILLPVLVVIFIVVLATMRVSFAVAENKFVFTGADVTEVDLPIVQYITSTSRMPLFSFYAERASLDERITFELLASSLKLVTGFSLVETMTVISFLLMLVPPLFSYLIAIRITNDKWVGILSAVFISAFMPPPILGSGPLFSLVIFPVILYFTMLYLDNKLPFLPLLLISFIGFVCHAPLFIVFMLTVAFYGFAMALFSSKAKKNRAKYLNLIIITPVVIFAYFPVFKGLVYPAVYSKTGEFFVNQPFNLYLNTLLTLWNASAPSQLLLTIITVGLISVLGFYVSCRFIFHRSGKRLNAEKLIERVRKMDNELLSVLFLFPWIIALVFANFDLPSTFNSLGEFNRPIFNGFFIFLLVGLFSAFFLKNFRFLVFIYLPMYFLILKPFSSFVGLGFLSLLQMDRGYYFGVLSVAIGASVTIVGCFKKLR